MTDENGVDSVALKLKDNSPSRQDATSIQTLSGADNIKPIEKESLVQVSDGSNIQKNGNANVAETFTRIPGLSFINNSLFTNMLRSKEPEETPMLQYESTRAERMKSRQMYRRLNKRNEVILAEQVNGYCGDKSISDIVEYIEGTKSAKKKKSRKNKDKKNVEIKDNQKDIDIKPKEKQENINKINEDNKIMDTKETNAKACSKKKRKVKHVKNNAENEDNTQVLKNDVKPTQNKVDNTPPIKIKQEINKKNTETKLKNENSNELNQNKNHNELNQNKNRNEFNQNKKKLTKTKMESCVLKTNDAKFKNPIENEKSKVTISKSNKKVSNNGKTQLNKVEGHEPVHKNPKVKKTKNVDNK